MITGILLKSYMAVARLMGAVDKKRRREEKVNIPSMLPKVPKKIKLKEA